jgi:hypothetical protein
MAASVIFFGFLWLLDFPKPGFDDLFYTGAALNLAKGGDFSNPLLARQMFPSHFFFVYPPLHSYVLAGWLKIVGIHTASQTGFVMLNLLVICWATISIMRRRQAPRWAEWLVPLGVSYAFLANGLRPEIFATSLALAGFALTELETAKKSKWPRYAGYFLMFLGISCAPRVSFFALALASCAGFEAWRSANSAGERWQTVAAWLTAGFGSAFISLMMIHFRVHEFLTNFHLHSTRVSGKSLEILVDYLKSVGTLQLPLVFLPVLMLFDVFRKPLDSAVRLCWFVAAAFIPVILTGGVGHGTIWWPIFLMLVAVGIIGRSSPPWRAFPIQVLVVAALLVANRKLVVNVGGILTGQISSGIISKHEWQKITFTPEHPLIVDGSAARYAFDYQLPEGTIAVEDAGPFPSGFPGDIGDSDLRPGDTYIVGPATVHLLMWNTYLEVEVPVWRAFGLRAFEFDKFPRQIFVVREEDCKHSRHGSDYWPIYMPERKPGNHTK